MYFLPKLLLSMLILYSSVVSAGNGFCKFLTGEGAQVVPVGTDREQVDRSVRDRNIYIF